MKKIRKKIKDTKLPLFIDLIKWICIDIYRVVRYGKRLEFSEFICFVGRKGEGKTIAMAKELADMKIKYGEDLLVFTNFDWEFEDGKINHWKDLLVKRDRPVVYAYDEMALDFDSRDYKNLPATFFQMMALARKQGVMLVVSAQMYEHIDKRIRQYLYEIRDVKKYLGRLHVITKYDHEAYEQMQTTKYFQPPPKIKTRGKYAFVGTDRLRRTYDTNKLIDRTRNTEYIPMSDKKIDYIEPIVPTNINLKFKKGSRK